MKNRLASYYALDPRMIELVDELILVDNRAKVAKIIATRRRDGGVVISPDDAADSLVDRPDAFYGLTIQSNPKPQIVDSKSKKAGGSRKRRIITRRRRLSRYNKKTIKHRRHPRSHHLRRW
jgi:hypothetical protein